MNYVDMKSCIKLLGFLLLQVKCQEVKVWEKNTNFGNLNNWVGIESNCSSNIFLFPPEMEKSVVAMPTGVIETKQIILPLNGHFVFSEGSTSLGSQNGLCQGTEGEFVRTLEEDWFEPSNWIGPDSLLSSKAIPHVEAVPCQFDSVKFPPNSSFKLRISDDVSVRRVFVGNTELNYTSIALMMTTQLGKLQFLKDPQTHFGLLDSDCSREKCVCDNYKEKYAQKICSFVKCAVPNSPVKCTSPMMPPGFCCPICAFHLKIIEGPEFSLPSVKKDLKASFDEKNFESAAFVFATRSDGQTTHIYFLPLDSTVMERLRDFVKEVHFKLANVLDGSIGDIKLVKSWQDKDEERTSEKFEKLGLGGGTISILLVLGLVLIGGVAIFILYWRKEGYPPLTGFIPSIPSINFPTDFDFIRRRSSSGPSFAFARFANERISHLNIGELSAQTDSPGSGIEEESGERVTENEGFGFADLPCQIDGATTVATSGEETEGNKDEKIIYDLVDVSEASTSARAEE